MEVRTRLAARERKVPAREVGPEVAVISRHREDVASPQCLQSVSHAGDDTRRVTVADGDRRTNLCGRPTSVGRVLTDVVEPSNFGVGLR